MHFLAQKDLIHQLCGGVCVRETFQILLGNSLHFDVFILVLMTLNEDLRSQRYLKDVTQTFFSLTSSYPITFVCVFL